MTSTDIFDIKKPSAFQLAAFESVDSTNDEARRRAIDGAPHGLVIASLEQTKGRGRRGRTWVSQPGNLFCSLMIRPNVSVSDGAKVSFVTSLAIYDAIQEAVGDFDCDITCKWPNDVLIDGYKVSGILLESQAQTAQKLDWLIIGIGINLAHSPEDTPYPSGYINAYRDNALTPAKMLEILLPHLQIWLERWETLGFQAIRNAWLERAKGVGEQITVNLEREQIVGMFETLDHDGGLVLRTNTEQRTITAGDVFFKS